MRGLLAIILLIFAAPAAAAATPVASVTIERSGEIWTADYEFHERAPVWAFVKSNLPHGSKTSWRLGTVRVLTPGVRLQRLGNFDALVASGGPMPPHVRLSFTPYFEALEGAYDPAFAFTDGSVALYAEQFRLVPMKSTSWVRGLLPGDPRLTRNERPSRLTFGDQSGPVLAYGKRERRPTIDSGATYVVFGPVQSVIGSAMTTIIDPALPRWITDYLNAELPQILARYREELGPPPAGHPTLLVSWGGSAAPEVSLTGSVLPGLVVMKLQGRGLLEPNERVGRYARWFVSHEAAHFWLGQAVSYDSRAESWITEGGAELLAFRATAAADRTYDVRPRLTEAREECAPFLRSGGVAQAYAREGDFRAYYACGAIIALAAERASGGDFGKFIRTLIERNRDDGIVTRGEWLALIEEQAPGRGLGVAIANLLDEAQPDPKLALDNFIAAAGISGQFSLAETKP